MDLKDSGARKQFESGAVRDITDGKGRMDLVDLDYLYEVFGDDPVIGYIRDFMNSKNVDFLSKSMCEFVRFRYGNCFSTAMIEVSKQFEDGAKKYSPNNWRKGISLHCYIDSALRHYMKVLRGDTDEPHDRAVLWNLMCGRWTYLNRPECDDIHNEGDEDGKKEKVGI